ncbi:hypothetical protein Tco_0695773 [Tanacetum coccineum]
MVSWRVVAVTCGGGVVAVVAVVVATSGGSGEWWWRRHVVVVGGGGGGWRWVDIAEAENASLRAKIRTLEAIEMVTRNHARLAHIEIERQLASVQESHHQDREDFRKLKEFVTSQFGQRS